MVGSRKDYFAPSSQIRINGITVFDFCSESSILLHIQACSPALHKKAKVDLLLHLHFAVFNYSAVIMTEKLLKLYISAGSIRYLTNIPEPMTYLMSFMWLRLTKSGHRYKIYRSCADRRQKWLSGFLLHTAASLGVQLRANVPHAVFLSSFSWFLFPCPHSLYKAGIRVAQEHPRVLSLLLSSLITLGLYLSCWGVTDSSKATAALPGYKYKHS